MLTRYTIQYNEEKSRWELKKDGSDIIIQSFSSKEAATEHDRLKKILGKEGGSVKIQKKNGRFQEERTYPRAADPRRSIG